MVNVAILAASRHVTLVKYFRKALHLMGGGKVYALDASLDKVAQTFADESYMIPKTSHEDYCSFLLDFCRQENIDLLFSCRDEDLLELPKIKNALKESGCRAMVADRSVIEICNNKFLFNDFCLESGFDTPKTYRKDENIEFPVFIKPLFGKGSVNTFKVKDEKFLHSVVEHFDEEFIVQEYVQEKEYTVDLFADFCGKVISVVPRERVLTVAGESYVGKTYKNQVLIDESVRLAETLHLVGHNTIQCFFDGKNVKFIEVNPRFGGGAALGFESGHSTPEYLIRLVKGESLKPVIGEFENGMRMLRYTTDLFVSKKEYINKTFCVDIDGTICTEGEEYEAAKPIDKTVQKINNLYEAGNTIVLFTSRGVASGRDWGELTKKQLASWGVKYHDLKFKKPYADYYIDNKAVDVLDWI